MSRNLVPGAEVMARSIAPDALRTWPVRQRASTARVKQFAAIRD
jgi:hypothetical protein